MYLRAFDSYRQTNAAMRGWQGMGRAPQHQRESRGPVALAGEQGGLPASRLTSGVGTVRGTPFGHGVVQTVSRFRQTMNDASHETRDAQSPAARKGSDTAAVSDSPKGTPWPL